MGLRQLKQTKRWEMFIKKKAERSVSVDRNGRAVGFSPNSRAELLIRANKTVEMSVYVD